MDEYSINYVINKIKEEINELENDLESIRKHLIGDYQFPSNVATMGTRMAEIEGKINAYRESLSIIYTAIKSEKDVKELGY